MAPNVLQPKIMWSDMQVLSSLYVHTQNRFAAFELNELSEISKVVDKKALEMTLRKLVRRELITEFTRKGRPSRWAISEKGIKEFQDAIIEAKVPKDSEITI